MYKQFVLCIKTCGKIKSENNQLVLTHHHGYNNKNTIHHQFLNRVHHRQNKSNELEVLLSQHYLKSAFLFT